MELLIRQYVTLFLLLSAVSLLRAEETLVPPKKLSSRPANTSLLVYPEDASFNGYTVPKPQRLTAQIPRRYTETPVPETLDKTTTIRSVAALMEKGQTEDAAAEVKPAPQLAETLPSTDTVAPKDNIDPVHPPVRTAAFQGVVPGETVSEQVLKLWGEPLQTSTLNGQPVHLYSTEILNHIEIIYKDNVVRSIIVRLEEPFPEEQVRDVLKTELLKSKPVLIPDENGEIIGEVFPEKGVLFLFAPMRANKKLFVQQIGIEMVTSESFALRAEATLNDQPSEAMRDSFDAVRINPEDAKAFWLLAQAELTAGDVESALIHTERSIKLDEHRPAYHLTYVQALVRMNRIEEAKLYLEETIGICDRYPHEKARALSLLGDLYRTSQNPDYEIAIECHSDAIRLATALIDNDNPTVRQSAKDVLFEAHLGAAKDVAWGKWDKKEEAINKWISRAGEITRDPEMKAAKRFSNEYPFKIAVCMLAVQVGLPNQADIEPFIQDVVDAGQERLKTASDPVLLQKIYWETGLSLYDAVQIEQLRKRYTEALKYGELAAEYMEKGIKDRKSETDLYLLGRLYFRLGAIHAIGNQNHRAAIEWFELAKLVFEKLLPRVNPEALGRLGETFVSMGVSYWYTDRRDEAIRLTERGLKQIERGIRSKTLDASALTIPYTNLAKMYAEMGQTDSAERYTKLSTALSSKEQTLK
ncbi:MAG: hypothetical protein LBN39_02260 [Planctomycetaceae bacterium]|jgi:tetratricopeptide (TPR) repeat protein|nr:hypothetical protein [Planctomycetaceae bacterium]